MNIDKKGDNKMLKKIVSVLGVVGVFGLVAISNNNIKNEQRAQGTEVKYIKPEDREPEWTYDSLLEKQQRLEEGQEEADRLNKEDEQKAIKEYNERQEEVSVIETPQTQTVENKQNVKQEAKEKKSVNKKQEVEQNELEEYSLRDLYTKEDFEIVRQLMIDGVVPEIGTLDENGKEITFKDIESELDSYLDNEERLIQQLND